MNNYRKSHFQEKEPLLEGLLSYLRFRCVVSYIPKNSRVLDLGCGYNGFFLLQNRDRILSGVGVDVSVDESNLYSKIKLVKHDLNQNLPFENEEFDVVVSLANLEHLEYPVENVKEIFRVLRPGGILLLTTPSIFAKPVLEFLSFKLKLINAEEIRDHKNYFNKSILLDLFKKVGFSQVKHSYFQLFMNNFVYARK